MSSRPKKRASRLRPLKKAAYNYNKMIAAYNVITIITLAAVNYNSVIDASNNNNVKAVTKITLTITTIDTRRFQTQVAP